MSEQNSASIWITDKCDAPTDQPAMLQACLQRLDWAHGHINAIERKLWYDTDRGVWSANQAKARIAEILLWLRDGLNEISSERYIHKSKLPELVNVLEGIIPSSSPLLDVKESEAAILTEPFPILRGTLNHEERQALNLGIALQDRYINALRGLLEVAEDAVAKRFLALQAGDWLRLLDGNSAVVCSVHGLSVRVFIPAWATGDLLQAMQLYWLVRARLVPIAPQNLPVLEPAHYWLSLSHNLLQSARHHLHDSDDLKVVRDVLTQALDAAAKSWWLANAPGERQVTWGHSQLRNVHLLHGKAPHAVTETLCSAANSIEHLSRSESYERIGELNGSWALQLAVMIEALGRVLKNLESDLSLSPSSLAWQKGRRLA